MGYNIAPAPIVTMDDLLAKLDLISGGIHQFQDDREAELARAIQRGVDQIMKLDLARLKGTRKQWKQANQKMAKMRELMRQIRVDQSSVS